MITVLHGRIVDLGRLPIGNAPSLLALVQEQEVQHLETDNGNQGTGEGHCLLEAGQIVGRVLLVEQKRADDVAGGHANVEERHDDGSLGGAANVGDHPRDEERVGAEEEREHVVGG